MGAAATGSPSITLVVAAGTNGVIGRDGDMPWHLPADLAHFKQVTLGKPVLMGRRTPESIGRPLPGRLNLVLSKNPAYRSEGCGTVGSLADALAVAAREGAAELMVIGGGGVYAEALPLADRILLTRVHVALQGDTYFPALDPDEWQEASRQERAADARNAFDLSFLELVRCPRRPGRSGV
jgi:dihydrofolate reductase